MKKLALMLVLLLSTISPTPSLSQPISQVVPLGTSLANSTSTTAAVPGTSTTVTLTAQSTNITISLPTGGASYLYVNFSGTAATTSNFAIPAGYSFTFWGQPGISTFKVIGSSASGNYSVLAH